MAAPSAPVEAPAKKQTANDLFESYLPKLREVASRDIDPAKLLRVAMVARSKNQKLAECSALSMLQCMMAAAETGLMLGGFGGEAFAVPYKGVATFQVGYQGLMKLARRSGQVSKIEAHTVHENDLFEYEYGTSEHLRHRPAPEEERGEAVAWYAIAKLSNGTSQFRVIHKSDVDRAKRSSRSASNADSPWTTDYNAMACKTAVIRLCKYLPRSVELDRALELDSEDFHATAEVEPTVAPQPKLTRTERLKQKLLPTVPEAPSDLPAEEAHEAEAEVGDGQA